MPQGHSVDDYLETIYFLAFPIGEYHPVTAGSPTLASRVAENVHADELGDTFSDEMVERIAVRLGNPDRCPHGWPVDTTFEQDENKELSPLSDLPPDSPATIVRLAEHDGELLHWFYDHGYVPGTEVRLEDVQRTAGPIADKAAAGLFVRAGA
jgi:DtxR family Mn-dependent transcriptional regulator